MRTTLQAATIPLLAALLATPILLPLSAPPVVTALAELWAWAVMGMVALVLGVQNWRQAPQQFAGFESPDRRRSDWPMVLMGAAALASLLSAFISVMQVWAPDVLRGPVGMFIQPSHLEGRAVGNLRQPNHLATVLLWGAIAWGALQAQSRMSTTAAATGMGLLMMALVLSGSRTGLLGTLILLGWATIDRRLPRATRTVLALAPVMAALIWGGLQLWSRHQGLELSAATHLNPAASGDISSSRFAIWRNTWELIRQQPWTGVGWGWFNIAWTLTPMVDRPVALFSHAHNLPLQLMVELGVPLGLSVFGALIALWIWGAKRAWAWEAAGDEPVCRRAAWVMTLAVGLHSLLEYPLWYAYLGIPSVLALLVCLGLDRPWKRTARWQGVLQVFIGGTFIMVAGWAHSDYRTINAIYAPGPQSGTLHDRIERGVQGTWYADQAHYARATTNRPVVDQPWDSATTKAFDRAPHVLLDPRLMMAWADALAARGAPGDRDLARHLAARLREFKAPMAQPWLRACEDPATPQHRRFVCETPEQMLTWRDFGLC